MNFARSSSFKIIKLLSLLSAFKHSQDSKLASLGVVHTFFIFTAQIINRFGLTSCFDLISFLQTS